MEPSVFAARVADTATLCERTGVPKFLGFLAPAEVAAAQKILQNGDVRFCFDGGYEQAERTVLCCLPDWCEETVPPIAAFTVSYRPADRLTHRDFLGALMALGITRESVGDILVEEGRTVLFVRSEIASFVREQLCKVGRVGVSVNEGFSLPLPQIGQLVLCTDTVASARLDAVVAALCGCSRNQAVGLIEDGLVAVNSAVCEKGTKTVNSGDRVTVRGKGRFEIRSVDTLTKKGRILLEYGQYR